MRQETSKTASRQLVHGAEFLQGLRSEVVAKTAEQNQLSDFANKTWEELKTAETDVALQLSLWKAALKKWVRSQWRCPNYKSR